jgi:16S rRNA U1498 N3-methylase RsmE
MLHMLHMKTNSVLKGPYISVFQKFDARVHVQWRRIFQKNAKQSGRNQIVSISQIFSEVDSQLQRYSNLEDSKILILKILRF